MVRHAIGCILCLLVLLSSNIATCETTTKSDSLPGSANDDNQTCNLTLGWGDWPPYQTIKNGDTPIGIQIDLIKQIAQEAGCQLTFKLQTFSQNQKSIKEGSIDLTLDTTITEARKEYAYFSIPYRNEVMVLYVRPNYVTACQIKHVAEFIQDGFRLGVTTGNIYGEAISAVQADEVLNRLLIYRERNSQHFELFKQKEIDGFIEDPTVMGYKLREDPDIGPLTPCKIAVKSSPVSIMFSKKTVTTTQIDAFNNAIERVKQTAEYKKLWEW